MRVVSNAELLRSTVHWWPQDIGSPSATGSQNNVRYAYFADARRLAVETNGQVWVYDTLDHMIGGFSQQQGGTGSILFTSQYGTVNLSELPVISIDGRPQPQPSQTDAPRPDPGFDAPMSPPPAPRQDTSAGAPTGQQTDIFAAIERLGDLRAKGILTDQEFAEKKGELLGRL